MCDKCRSEAVVEYKLNLVKPEPGSGDRMRNATVFTKEFELCAECAQAVWQAAEKSATETCRQHKSTA